MANKNNIRSIRFSDEMADLIDRQQGDTFTQKFENLVTRCVWELPEKEKELEQLDVKIKEKRKQFQEMTAQIGELRITIYSLTTKIRDFENNINQALAKWKT